MKFWSLLACLLFTTAFLQAQSYVTKKTVGKKERKKYDKAVQLSRSGKYDKALDDLDDLLEDEPQFVDAALLQAAIYYDQDQYDLAEAKYEEVLSYASDYRTRTFYEVALTELKQQKFEDASAHLQAFLEKEKRNDRLIARAEEHLKRAKFSAKAIKNPVPFKPKAVEGDINTENREYLISLSAEENHMVITRRIGKQEDFYQFEKTDGQWKALGPMEDINTPLSEGAQSLSADGKTLVYTACNRKDGYGDCDLYIATKNGDQWSEPMNIGSPINTKAWESQPSLSSDGQALYFASNRNGADDLWVSYRQTNGKWGQPQNLGEPINSPGKEITPFIHADGHTLYFTSDGHPGMGALDLFVSRKQEDGSWGTPQNLGYPINTEAAEGALVVQLDGRTAYFARDAKAKQAEDELFYIPNEDIYYFELPEAARATPSTYVKAKVYDAETRYSLDAAVEILGLKKQESIVNTRTGEDGEFLLCLPVGKDYALNVSKKGYLFHSENFALEQARDQTDPFLLEIPLYKVPKQTQAEDKPAPIVLKNIFFESGSAILLDKSFYELEKLYRLLNENPDMKIQLNGHTDNIGSEEDNQQLSENRAKAVYDYLIKKGIIADRLAYKGFGESQPIATNDTPEGRQQNRRTEFEILK